MAKVSMIQRQLKRQRIVAKYATKRAELVAISKNESLKPEERFKARMDIAKLPRDGSKTRLKSRCEVTGRPRGYYRKLKMSRIALRELGSMGKIPGLVKSSW